MTKIKWRGQIFETPDVLQFLYENDIEARELTPNKNWKDENDPVYLVRETYLIDEIRKLNFK